MLFLIELRILLHIYDELELPSGHALELVFELICVTTKELDNLWVLNTIE